MTFFVLTYVIGLNNSKMIHESEMTDREVVERYKKDRQEGFRLLYCKYADKLLAVCRRYSTDDEIAMDYLHEGMIKIYEKLASFRVREEGSLFRWMSRVTINSIIDSIRRDQHSHFKEVTIKEEYSGDEQEEASQVPLETIYDMIGKLTPSRRVVFNLSCIEGRSRKEIAKELGITEAGVSSTLWKARQELSRMVMNYYKKLDL